MAGFSHSVQASSQSISSPVSRFSINSRATFRTTASPGVRVTVCVVGIGTLPLLIFALSVKASIHPLVERGIKQVFGCGVGTPLVDGCPSCSCPSHPQRRGVSAATATSEQTPSSKVQGRVNPCSHLAPRQNMLVCVLNQAYRSALGCGVRVLFSKFVRCTTLAVHTALSCNSSPRS